MVSELVPHEVKCEISERAATSFTFSSKRRLRWVSCPDLWIASATSHPSSARSAARLAMAGCTRRRLLAQASRRCSRIPLTAGGIP